MAVGKNKRLSKGKKGSKKKAYVLSFIFIVDEFSRMAMLEWDDVESCQGRPLAAEAGGTAASWACVASQLEEVLLLNFLQFINDESKFCLFTYPAGKIHSQRRTGMTSKLQPSST